MPAMDITWNELPGPAPRYFGFAELWAMRQDYLGTLARYRRLGDVTRLRISVERTLDIFDPELLRRVMLEHADAQIRWERATEVFGETLGQSVLVTEGATWQRQRRMLMPAFAPKRMAGYAGFMAEAAREALAACPGGLVAMDAFFSHVTMDVILRVLFSARAGSETAEAAAATQVLSETGFREMFWPLTLPDWLPLPGKAAKRRALAFMRGLLRRHLDAPPRPGAQDLLTQLRALRDEDTGEALSEQEVFDQCITTFQAGHETTATALLWWAWLMAEHPEAQARAVAELQAVLGSSAPTPDDLPTLPWLSATLKEAMRLYPPAAVLVTRRLTRDVVLPWRDAQLHLPKGAMLRCTPYLLHRDARVWAQPEAFRPERFLPGASEVPRGAYMPFGQGPRVCLGQHFAMLEMSLVAALVLQAFELSPSGDPAPRLRLAVTLRPAGGLRLRLQPRRAGSAIGG